MHGAKQSLDPGFHERFRREVNTLWPQIVLSGHQGRIILSVQKLQSVRKGNPEAASETCRQTSDAPSDEYHMPAYTQYGPGSDFQRAGVHARSRISSTTAAKTSDAARATPEKSCDRVLRRHVGGVSKVHMELACDICLRRIRIVWPHFCIVAFHSSGILKVWCQCENLGLNKA